MHTFYLTLTNLIHINKGFGHLAREARLRENEHFMSKRNKIRVSEGEGVRGSAP